MRLASWLFSKRRELETDLCSRPESFRECRVIVVTNQKGGSFKTGWTVCYSHMFINSQNVYSIYGRPPRVAIIGMDPSCGVEKAFGLDAKALEAPKVLTVVDALHDRSLDGIDPVPPERIVRRYHQIDLYPASPRLSLWETSMDVVRARYASFRDMGATQRAETEVEKLHEMRLLLKRFVDKIRPRYDRIVIDCRPGEGQLALAPLFAADWVHIPTFLTDASISQARRRAELVEQARQVNPDLRLMAVIPTNLHRGNALQRNWLWELSQKPSNPTKYDFSRLVVSPIWYNARIDLIIENAQTRVYRSALQKAVGTTFDEVLARELKS